MRCNSFGGNMKKRKTDFCSVHEFIVTVFFILASVFAGCQKDNTIVVFYTNDVYCAIEENTGYAGLAEYRDSLLEKTPYVTLVDCRDAVQGDLVGTVSQGEYI